MLQRLELPEGNEVPYSQRQGSTEELAMAAEKAFQEGKAVESAKAYFLVHVRGTI